MKFSLDESNYRAFDISAKLIGGFSAIVLLYIGYLQFKALYVKEFGLKFYSEKIEYVVELNRIMGQISTDRISDELLSDAISNFKLSFYVKDIFIEDDSLLNSLNDFNGVVNTFRSRIERRKTEKVILHTSEIMTESKEIEEIFAKRSNKILKNHITQ